MSKTFALLTLVFSLVATAQSQPERGRPEMIFVPLGIYYVDGAFANMGVVTKDQKIPAFDTVDACIDFLKAAIAAAMQSGSVPNGGQAIGGCIPVHRLMPTT